MRVATGSGDQNSLCASRARALGSPGGSNVCRAEDVWRKTIRSCWFTGACLAAASIILSCELSPTPASRRWRAPSPTSREVVRLTGDAVAEPAAPPEPVPGPPARPRVVMHIGEPKTGTTFLQQVMWRNRSELAARGVVLPGHHPQDHFRASQDLRGIEKLPTDPAGSWTGEWEILASQAQQAGKTPVISHELFCAADSAQAGRAVRSLARAQVHVVLTVRDVATLLPAEWQETVKHRNTRSWEDWLEDVIDRESVSADRRQWWFWRAHDTLAILELWSRHVPPERVHVIMVPPRGSDERLLW